MLLYMCYYQNVNNDITLDSFRPVLHWEKCGEILFFSKILCFLEKSLLSFREKSYFFEKRQDFLMIFPSMQELFSDCFESGNSRTGTGFQIPAQNGWEGQVQKCPPELITKCFKCLQINYQISFTYFYLPKPS